MWDDYQTRVVNRGASTRGVVDLCRVADEIVEMAELPDPLSPDDEERWYRLVAGWRFLTGDRSERMN